MVLARMAELGIISRKKMLNLSARPVTYVKPARPRNTWRHIRNKAGTLRGDSSSRGGWR